MRNTAALNTRARRSEHQSQQGRDGQRSAGPEESADVRREGRRHSHKTRYHVEHGRRRMTFLVRARGHISPAEVDEPKVSIEQNTASITISVKEGPRTLLHSIEVSGAVSIPLEEIQPLISLKQGDPYNEVDIADTGQGSQTSIMKGDSLMPW